MIFASKEKNVDHRIHNIIWDDRRQGTAYRTDCWGHAGHKYVFLLGQFTTAHPAGSLLSKKELAWRLSGSLHLTQAVVVLMLLFHEEHKQPAAGTPSVNSKSSSFTSSSKTRRFWNMCFGLRVVGRKGAWNFISAVMYRSSILNIWNMPHSVKLCYQSPGSITLSRAPESWHHQP